MKSRWQNRGDVIQINLIKWTKVLEIVIDIFQTTSPYLFSIQFISMTCPLISSSNEYISNIFTIPFLTIQFISVTCSFDKGKGAF